jgi:phytoene desaturase
MNRSTPHALVIGAGIGGLACAARLVAAGLRTTIVEVGERAGGRCGGFREDGFTLDFATHMFSISRAGEVARAAALVGSPVEFVVRDPVAQVWLGERQFPFPGRFDSPLRLARLAWDVGIARRDTLGTLRHLASLCRGAPELAEDSPEDLRGWALRHTRNPGYHQLLNLLSFLAFVVPYDEAGAKEMARCFTRIVRGPGIGYPRGGCLALIEGLVRGIERRGGHFRFGQRVEEIRVDGGRVAGVSVDGRSIDADWVFCNAGVRATVALAGADAVGPELAGRAATLTDSMAAVMLRYRLDRPVIPDPVLFVMPSTPAGRVCELIRAGRLEETGAGFYVTVPSNFDPALAPPGKQVVVAGTLAPAEVAQVDRGRAMLTSMEGRLAQLYPELPGAIIDRQWVDVAAVARASGRRERGAAVGLAQTPAQTGPGRPHWQTAARGLYIVGADTGRGAIGTELAAGSGLDAAEHALSGRAADARGR